MNTEVLAKEGPSYYTSWDSWKIPAHDARHLDAERSDRIILDDPCDASQPRSGNHEVTLSQSMKLCWECQEHVAPARPTDRFPRDLEWRDVNGRPRLCRIDS